MKGRALPLLLLLACNNNSTTATKPPDAPTSATPADAAPAAPTSASAAASGTAPNGSAMLADEALQQAVSQKQDILVVKVKEIAQEGAGSRSALTTYSLDVVKVIAGTASGAIKLSHYGAPQLASNKTYAITTRGGNPAWGTKGLKDSVEVPPGQEEAVAAAHKKKVDALPK